VVLFPFAIQHKSFCDDKSGAGIVDTMILIAFRFGIIRLHSIQLQGNDILNQGLGGRVYPECGFIAFIECADFTQIHFSRLSGWGHL
jgi:hypothetical protein